MQSASEFFNDFLVTNNLESVRSLTQNCLFSIKIAFGSERILMNKMMKNGFSDLTIFRRDCLDTSGWGSFKA